MLVATKAVVLPEIWLWYYEAAIPNITRDRPLKLDGGKVYHHVLVSERWLLSSPPQATIVVVRVCTCERNANETFVSIVPIGVTVYSLNICAL